MSEGGVQTEVKERKPLIVKSFKTAKGSVYTYDKDRKTTRFKTATGEQEPRQDITVFVDLTPDEEQEVLSAYLLGGDSPSRVYVLEANKTDNKPRVYTGPRNLYNLIRSKRYGKQWDTTTYSSTSF